MKWRTDVERMTPGKEYLVEMKFSPRQLYAVRALDEGLGYVLLRTFDEQRTFSGKSVGSFVEIERNDNV
jgi:hypothetical protein